MTTRWSANDTEFDVIRQHMKALQGNVPELDREVTEARKRCDSKNATASDLYRWSSAVLSRATDDFDYGRRMDMTSDGKKPMDLFPRLSVPNSYAFTRIRFLIVSWMEFPNHKMVPLAEALRRHDPMDRAVTLTLLYLYQPSAPNIYPNDRAKGEALVKFIDAHFQQSVSTWAKTGWFYYTAWMYTKSKADATEAIRRYAQARKLTKSAEQRKFIDKERETMIRGTPGLKVGG